MKKIALNLGWIALLILPSGLALGQDNALDSIGFCSKTNYLQLTKSIQKDARSLLGFRDRRGTVIEGRMAAVNAEWQQQAQIYQSVGVSEEVIGSLGRAGEDYIASVVLKKGLSKLTGVSFEGVWQTRALSVLKWTTGQAAGMFGFSALVEVWQDAGRLRSFDGDSAGYEFARDSRDQEQLLKADRLKSTPNEMLCHEIQYSLDSLELAESALLAASSAQLEKIDQERLSVWDWIRFKQLTLDAEYSRVSFAKASSELLLLDLQFHYLSQAKRELRARHLWSTGH